MHLIKSMILKNWQRQITIYRYKFSRYKNDKKYDNLSFVSKFDFLKELHDKLEKLNKTKSIKNLRNKIS